MHQCLSRYVPASAAVENDNIDGGIEPQTRQLYSDVAGRESEEHRS